MNPHIRSTCPDREVERFYEIETGATIPASPEKPTEVILDEIAARVSHYRRKLRGFCPGPSDQSLLFELLNLGDWIDNGFKPLRTRTPEEIHKSRRPRPWLDGRLQEDGAASGGGEDGQSAEGGATTTRVERQEIRAPAEAT